MPINAVQSRISAVSKHSAGDITHASFALHPSATSVRHLSSPPSQVCTTTVPALRPHIRSVSPAHTAADARAHSSCQGFSRNETRQTPTDVTRSQLRQALKCRRLAPMEARKLSSGCALRRWALTCSFRIGWKSRGLILRMKNLPFICWDWECRLSWRPHSGWRRVCSVHLGKAFR